MVRMMQERLGRRHRLIRRWAAFNMVGVMGAGIQISVLAALLSWSSLHYLTSTALAVEAVLLHNFLWHQRWTWSDRAADNFTEALSRLLRFKLMSGAVSIGGNLFFMGLLVGSLETHYLAANLITIISCSLLNFLANDRLVFRDVQEVEP